MPSDTVVSKFAWFTGPPDKREAWECERLDNVQCSQCGKVGAIVSLPPPLLAKQPDGTTHVCAPFFGGCNHGFARDP